MLASLPLAMGASCYSGRVGYSFLTEVRTCSRCSCCLVPASPCPTLLQLVAQQGWRSLSFRAQLARSLKALGKSFTFRRSVKRKDSPPIPLFRCFVRGGLVSYLSSCTLFTGGWGCRKPSQRWV